MKRASPPKPLMAALLFGAMALLAGACSRPDAAGSAASAAAPAAPEPVPAPAGWLADVMVARPKLSWAKVRAAAGELAGLIPATPGALVVTAAGLGVEALPLVDEDLPVVGALADAVGAGPGGRSSAATGAPAAASAAAEVLGVIGVHVRSGSGLVAALTAGAQARFAAQPADSAGLVRLRRKGEPVVAGPTAVGAAIGVLDNYLLFGSSERALGALGPYVARTASRQPPAHEDLVIQVGEAALHGPIQERVERALGKLDPRRWLPALAAVADVKAVGATLRGVLADAKAARLALELDAAGARLGLELEPSSPEAGRRFAAGGLVTPAVLLDLPDDSLLGAAWSEAGEGRADRARSSARSVIAALGRDLPAEVGAELGEALAALSAGRGDRTVAGLRCTGEGLTGFVHGTVADAGKLSGGLDRLLGLRRRGAVAKLLAASGLRLQTAKLRMDGLAAPVTRLRLLPPRQAERTDAPEPIDVLLAVAQDRFVAAAGMSARETLGRIHKPDAQRSLGASPAFARLVESLGKEAWAAVLADPLATVACRAGRPRTTAAAPVLLAAGASGSAGDTKAWLRLDVSVAVIRAIVAQRDVLW
ncbi:MAG: hypothetical protein HY744_08910 [Deltaproteobacteria bacterium]|nr:hypothetical protein [Deltaproteobacteria bacterium]